MASDAKVRRDAEERQLAWDGVSAGAANREPASLLAMALCWILC